MSVALYQSVQNYMFFQTNTTDSCSQLYAELTTPCLKKTVPVLFFEQLRETLAEFYNFW